MTTTTLKTHSFTVVLAGVDELTVEVADAVYGSGIDDALLRSEGPTLYLDFDREAESLGIGRWPAVTVAAGVLLGSLLIMWAAYRGLTHWQSVPSTWDALLAGRSGVSRITDDWIKDYPAQLVARLATDPADQIDRVRARRLRGTGCPRNGSCFVHIPSFRRWNGGTGPPALRNNRSEAIRFN